MPRSVPLAGRVLDVVGLTILVVGAGVYARSWIGLKGLAAEPPAGEESFAAMAEFNRFNDLADMGIALMIAGAVVMVVAAILARRLGRTSGDNLDAEPPHPESG